MKTIMTPAYHPNARIHKAATGMILKKKYCTVNFSLDNKKYRIPAARWTQNGKKLVWFKSTCRQIYMGAAQAAAGKTPPGTAQVAVDQIIQG